MPILPRLIWKEARARKVGFLLSAAAMAAAVALFTFLALTEEAGRRETKRVMRDLGFNLRVIPADTNMSQFYRVGFSDKTMPAEWLDKLAAVKNLSYNHLVGVLQGETEVVGERVFLLGISQERAPPGQQKPLMVQAVKPGEVEIGAEIADRLQLNKGDPLELAGRSFQVARRMPRMGSLEDLQIVGALSDVQSVLGLAGQLNEIKAIDCLCLTAADNPGDILQAEIQKTLPDTRVVMLSSIAEARARQRQMSDRNAHLVILAVLLAATAWIAALAILNVKQRTSEIGILRALGYGSLSIATLVLGRAVLVGLIGAVVGSAIGTWAALQYGPRVFEVTAKAIEPQWQLVWQALWATPLLTAAASLIPAAMAVVQDPAAVLRGQRLP
jgi:putative ABC transport system permease protein